MRIYLSEGWNTIYFVINIPVFFCFLTCLITKWEFSCSRSQHWVHKKVHLRMFAWITQVIRAMQYVSLFQLTWFAGWPCVACLPLMEKDSTLVRESFKRAEYVCTFLVLWILLWSWDSLFQTLKHCSFHMRMFVLFVYYLQLCHMRKERSQCCNLVLCWSKQTLLSGSWLWLD